MAKGDARYCQRTVSLSQDHRPPAERRLEEVGVGPAAGGRSLLVQQEGQHARLDFEQSGYVGECGCCLQLFKLGHAPGQRKKADPRTLLRDRKVAQRDAGQPRGTPRSISPDICFTCHETWQKICPRVQYECSTQGAGRCHLGARCDRVSRSLDATVYPFSIAFFLPPELSTNVWATPGLR